MSRSERLAARKELLLAQSQLQRMQLALYAEDARLALRPASLIGSALVRPAAFVAIANPIARLFGWHRLAHLLRLGAIAVGVVLAVRARRASSQEQPQ